MTVAFDEMNGSNGALRPAYSELSRWLTEVPPGVLDYRRREAELLFRRIGITFSVYGEANAQERLIPFDVLPRILAAAEWDVLTAGLEPKRHRGLPHLLGTHFSAVLGAADIALVSRAATYRDLAFIKGQAFVSIEIRGRRPNVDPVPVRHGAGG